MKIAVMQASDCEWEYSWDFPNKPAAESPDGIHPFQDIVLILRGWRSRNLQFAQVKPNADS